MLKNKLRELLKKRPRFSEIRKIFKLPELRFGVVKNLVNSWWRLIAVLGTVFILLYYPLGALISHKIDTYPDYEIHVRSGQSAAVSGMAFLVNREINEHLWTPNLPFFFPAVMLDNMPAFQSGIISAVGNVTASLSKRLNSTTLDGEEKILVNASKLLNYPPDIWMFSPQNKLVPAPSSTSQYRRGRRYLMAYNKALSHGEFVFKPRAADLQYILKHAAANLYAGSQKIEAHIRENSSSLIDGQADGVFYFQQGKLYAYLIIFKALGNDYKEVIVHADAYQDWTKLLNNLEKASRLAPTVIRNGEPDSAWAPNHLMAIDAYTNKAILNLWAVILQLEQNPEARL